MEASRKTFDRIKSRYVWIKKLLAALSLGPLILELGVGHHDERPRNATTGAHTEPSLLSQGEKRNWLVVTLIILWTCTSFILLF